MYFSHLQTKHPYGYLFCPVKYYIIILTVKKKNLEAILRVAFLKFFNGKNSKRTEQKELLGS